jgi:DDE family transposase
MAESVAFSSRASLVALGVRFQQLGIWSVVQTQVKIKQKIRKHTPLNKLLDCFINILAGGGGLVEVNTRVRPDRALQYAFARTTCAEQSTISDTLNACTPENVRQLRSALTLILRQHSRAYQHDYRKRSQWLDVDVTGMPAGRQGEGVTKGYFAKQPNRRGRQLGRVLATRYEEIVVDRLYEGNRQLQHSLQELLTSAEEVLDLTENRRKSTIVRVDGGGGEDEDINWVLSRDYYLLVKVAHWRRAEKLMTSVKTWYPDPKVREREVGWVTAPFAYVKATRQVALRSRKKNGEQSYHVLVFNLSDAMLFDLCDRTMPKRRRAREVLLAAVHAYDRRSGGLETQNKGDKQGLKLSHRNKHRFAAQEMLVLLGQLAHNLVIWARNDLARVDGRLQKYGIQRTVRDLLQIDGRIEINTDGRIQSVALNEKHPLTATFQAAFPDEM